MLNHTSVIFLHDAVNATRIVSGMSQNIPKTRRVSSPASTGAAGTIFEQHVDAYWLAQLLVRGIPPILHDCAVVEVHFQTEHLDWNTDDFLVVGENGSRSGRSSARSKAGASPPRISGHFSRSYTS